jgi:hypothetical protein
MKKILFFVFSMLLPGGITVKAQDTFSIVAIDSITGEIGSAGASCVSSSPTYPHGAQILSDVMPREIQPNLTSFSFHRSLALWLMIPAILPTSLLLFQASQYSASQNSNAGFFFGESVFFSDLRIGGHQNLLPL